MSESLTDPQACLQRMQANAAVLAHAKGNVVYLTEFRKTLKAMLMQASTAKTIQMKEADAYAHADYVQHLEALREATEEHERLRWRMVTDAAAVDVWRSQEASSRGMDRGTR